MVYALHESERDAMRASVVARALAIEGVDLVMWLERDAHDAPREAVIASPDRGELRFAPERRRRATRAGARWSVEGSSRCSTATRPGRGACYTPDYPDALARVWAALTCPTSGEVLLSAAPGYEFIDWGRQAHVGGGSHGSLHASRLARGARPQRRRRCPSREPGQWAIRDVAPLVLGALRPRRPA